MIPNEASCPVFSFTFRRKSVVELRMSGRKEKRKKKKEIARVYFFLFRPSFSLHLIFFVRCSFCRVSRFCAATPIMIFDQFGELQNADAWDFAEKKKDACGSAPYVRVHGRPNATCALFILFPKVAKKRIVCDFCTCYALWRNGEKMERKDAKRW